MRKVDIEHDAREIRAVVKQDVEVADIAAIVEVCDQPVILVLRRVCLKSMNLAIERRSDKLRPLTLREAVPSFCAGASACRCAAQ